MTSPNEPEVKAQGFDIPEHRHTHSLYVHCLSCGMFGTPMPARYVDAVQCGNCGSMETVKYYPSCCIEANRAGQKSALRLPEKKKPMEKNWRLYNSGWNDCLKAVKSLNEDIAEAPPMKGKK